MPRTLVSKITGKGFESAVESSELQKQSFADMLESRRPPQAQTDREFFQGRKLLGDEFDGDDRMLDLVVSNARKHGYNPNPTDVYSPGLARFIGDPLGFVPATGGRSHIKKVCEMTGRSCTGAVEYTAPAKPDPKPVRLAEDLVQKQMQEYIADNPDLGRDLPKLREEVIDKHGAPEVSD